MPEGGTDDELKKETAQNLNSLEMEYEQVNSRYVNLENETLEAKQKGVKTDNVTTDLEKAGESLKEAQKDLKRARALINKSEYDSAQSKINQARDHIETANNSISSGKTHLKRSYEAALNKARSDLQSAYKEYQIAHAYVNKASEAGGDTSNLENRLEKAASKIEKSRRAITENQNPKRANNLAEDAERSSAQIKNDSIKVAKSGITKERVSTLNARLDSDQAQYWIKQAADSGTSGDLETAEKRFEIAQYAEQVALYQNYVSDVATQEDIHLADLNESLQNEESKIAKGDVPQDLNQIEQGITRSRECIRTLNKVENTTRTIELEETWITTAESSEAIRLKNESKRELEEGNYEVACDKANKSLAEANSALENLREENNDKWYAFDLNIFEPDKADVRIDPPAVKKVEIKSISLNYDPPSDIQIERIDFDSPNFNINSPDFESNSRVEFIAEAETVEGDCGWTCKMAEATLTNVGSDAASDVTATVSIYVDKPDGSQIYKEIYKFDVIRPGESVTETDEVTAGRHANAVRENGARAVLKIEWKTGDVIIKKRFTI